jgi:hypothetical protein
MTRNEWSKLFALNDRLTHLYAAIENDVLEVEKTSGISMLPAMGALTDFAIAMTKATDKLNEKLSEDRASFQRQEEVDDVLRKVKNKIRFKERFSDDVREDRSEESD